MKLLFTYIPFQLLLGVLLGILYPITNIQAVLSILLLLLIMMALLPRFKKKSTFFNSFVFLLILAFGMTMSWFSMFYTNPLLDNNHYKNNNTTVTAVVRIDKQLKDSKTNKRFYASVKSINDTLTSGKILLNIPLKNIETSIVRVGDVLMIKSKFRGVKCSTSPYDFDYKSYLAKQQVYAIVNLNEHFFKIDENKSWIIKLQVLRDRVSYLLDRSNLSSQTIGLMKAMLLGDKEGITNQMQNSFTDSGVVHIIAISGMHIGVLYFMLLFVFGFLNRFQYGNYLYVIIVIFCLWSFAVFSGMSNSVVRSVTMFSFFTLTKLKKGDRLVLEAIVTSMLILLLADTNYVYSIGFQLSYTAVISIVVFYPLLSKWVKVKNKFLQYFIDVLVVSVVAQMGVLGFSLYYFHQLPMQFLFTNFFAVSLLPLVLYGGIIILIKLLITTKSSFLEFVFDEFISFYLEIINYFSSLTSWILKEVYIEKIEVFYYYTFLFGVWYLLNSISLQKIKHVLYLIIICQLVFLFDDLYLKKHTELLIYNTNHSVITIRQDENLESLSNNLLSENDLTLLKENQFKNEIKTLTCHKNEAFYYNNETYLIIDKNISYESLSLKDMILVISNNPKINFERLLVELKPKLIVIESSNYDYNYLKWKKTCVALDVPFYSVREKGAYQVKY